MPGFLSIFRKVQSVVLSPASIMIVIFIFLQLEIKGQTEFKKVLTLPKPELCAGRRIHSKLGSSSYFFSWLEPETKNLTLNWLDARNYCRDRCMDLISLELTQEILMLKKYIQFGNINSCWTSGRLCDFYKCERVDLEPLNINGWFWSGSGQKMRRTSEVSRYNDWSWTGGLGLPQPDNREGQAAAVKSIETEHAPGQTASNLALVVLPHPQKTNEACLAYLNNFYSDGIRWHDLKCSYTLSFACEDSPTLLKYAQTLNP